MGKLILMIVIFFALAIPKRCNAQNFNFDTTNSTFIKVETDTNNGIVVIKLRTNEIPTQEVLACKDVNAIISFSFKPTNIKVDNYEGNGSRPASLVRCRGMKLKVNRITLIGDNILLIELDKSLDGNEEVIPGFSYALLLNEKTPGFKMESVKRSFE